MHKKRALVLWGYLSLLALAACGPKVIDDSDLVSVDYIYTLENWNIVEQWSKDITIWEAGKLSWIEDIIRWAKEDEEFKWSIDWKDLYKSEYNPNLVQEFSSIILTDVMNIENPQIWNEIDTSSMWHGIITRVEKDDEWYDVYIVDFNNPKTYSKLSYLIKVTNIEKY
jgi:FKBP-type peptidyl-prolyl cis-trans isomerase 2